MQDGIILTLAHVLKLCNNGEWYHQTAFYFKPEFLKYYISLVNCQFQQKKYFMVMYLSVHSVLCLFVFVLKILGYPSQLPSLGIRSNQVWIPCHLQHHFLNRFSSLLPSSSLVNRLRSPVQTAKSLYKRDRLHISEKDQLTSFVLLPASPRSHTNPLQRNFVLCAESKYLKFSGIYQNCYINDIKSDYASTLYSVT